MSDLTVEFANKINDPKKGKFAPEISPLLWEIRRERQVELIFDGSRFSDILRWKKPVISQNLLWVVMWIWKKGHKLPIMRMEHLNLKQSWAIVKGM